MITANREEVSGLAAGLLATGAATAFVVLAWRAAGGPLFTAANALTTTRGLAAAGLASQAATRRVSLAAWLGLVAGCTLSDWLDGPLARRTGSTRLGAILDIEADSWLTLWAAIAAWRTGSLPIWCVLAPMARYPIRLRHAAGRSMGTRAWQRGAGTLQMCALAGALAPSVALRTLAARIAPLAALAQLAALAADLRGGS